MKIKGYRRWAFIYWLLGHDIRINSAGLGIVDILCDRCGLDLVADFERKLRAVPSTRKEKMR